jgi:hypothetical protein
MGNIWIGIDCRVRSSNPPFRPDQGSGPKKMLTIRLLRSSAKGGIQGEVPEEA